MPTRFSGGKDAALSDTDMHGAVHVAVAQNRGQNTVRTDADQEPSIKGRLGADVFHLTGI